MIAFIVEHVTMLPSDCAMWAIALVFIVLDVVVGTVKAVLQKSVNSEKARAGIMHKMGFVCALLLCTFIDCAQTIIDIGFQLPVLPVCFVMIVVAEIMSLCEHIKELNPNLSLDFLMKRD